MTQCLKALATKTDDLSLISGPTWEKVMPGIEPLSLNIAGKHLPQEKWKNVINFIPVIFVPFASLFVPKRISSIEPVNVHFTLG